MEKLIVAIATPVGKNGIGVVRMSGEGALDVAKKMFVPFNKKAKFEPNMMTLGKIDLGQTTDKGFLVFFESPKSYTGEDVVEFQCHGGIAVTEKIVEMAIKLGAQLAEPGEFSKRAFLNGKMTLDEAEGVIDVINAETASELAASSDLARGSLANKIKGIQNSLVDQMSEIEVNLDYPEHDIEYQTKENIKTSLLLVLEETKKLLSSEEKGKLIKNGINVAIVGRTNVGKSSLLNAILGVDQAIVTDVEGTTRDVVLGSIEFGGIKINFLDTAGLRKTTNKIENIGIEKSKKAIDESDIVLFVVDGNRKLDDEDKKIEKLIKNKICVFVANKSDLPQKFEHDSKFVSVSAKNNVGIDELKAKIFEVATRNITCSSTVVLTNSRHLDCLRQAKKMIEEAVISLEEETLDLTALNLRLIYEKFGEITGETVDEKVVDRIFSKFCLGK